MRSYKNIMEWRGIISIDEHIIIIIIAFACFAREFLFEHSGKMQRESKQNVCHSFHRIVSNQERISE